MESEKKYNSIVSHYEKCLNQFGDSCQGVNWPNVEDAERRYRVMLEVVRDLRPAQAVSLLDFGCGAAHLLEFLRKNGIHGIDYTGLDISADFVELCRRKYPDVSFLQMDILDAQANLPKFDYIIMNGVFTVKRELSYDEMWDYFRAVMRKAYLSARKGIAFNVMCKQVDWEATDLFYLPFDALAEFLVKDLSQCFVIRNDYGLYEYTVYLYRS